jgi:hypothetical protein
MSKSSCSKIATSFRYVRPRTFMLPTVIPNYCHLYVVLGLFVGRRLDPFVRLLAFYYIYCDLLKWGRFRLGRVEAI